MAKLTEQKKLFVQEYLKLKCRNQTQAAINAGYSAKTAAAQASGLMKQDEVKGYLEEQKSALEGQIRETFLFDALEARKVMYEILVDPEAENRDRLNAAKDFLGRPCGAQRGGGGADCGRHPGGRRRRWLSCRRWWPPDSGRSMRTCAGAGTPTTGCPGVGAAANPALYRWRSPWG